MDIRLRNGSAAEPRSRTFGWFAQYNSSGQVKVSDDVNGAWTRSSASTTYLGGTGDIALYYLQDSSAASTLTITISAATATYLQGSAAEFSGVATTGALVATSVASANSTSVASGATASVAAGQLVVGGINTGGSPGSVTPGSTQGQAFTMGPEDSAGSADLEYVTSSASGTQDATASFSSATDWYGLAAVFKPAKSSTTTTYAYNGDGLRMSETAAGGATQQFTWATLGSLPALLADGHNDYLYAPGSSTPLEQISVGGAQPTFLVADRTGIREQLSTSGAVVGSATYATYGTPCSTCVIGTPFGFAGGYTDATGMLYLLHRYYDPGTGQFISVDPDLAATGAPYQYVGGDPVNLTDPTGEIEAPTSNDLSVLSIQFGSSLSSTESSGDSQDAPASQPQGIWIQIIKEVAQVLLWIAIAFGFAAHYGS